MEGNMLKITFSTGDVANFKNSFANFLFGITTHEQVDKLHDFKIDFSDERVILSLPAEVDAFAFLAMIVKDIHDFKIDYISTPVVNSEDTQLQDTNPMENSNDPMLSGSAKLYGYISSRKTFSFRELRKKFPDMTSANISVVLNRLIKKNIIIRTDQGQYVLNSSKKDSFVTQTLSNKVRDYIFSCKTFSVKSVQKNVPDVPVANIRSVIEKLSNSKYITRIGRGEYKVNSLNEVDES